MSAGVERARKPGIGERALDTKTGRIGLVKDILDYVDPALPKHLDPQPIRTAFLWPVGGGKEWTTLPTYLEFPPDSSRST
ncbi:hypothetical protein J7E99_34310 [Streptomyces sp. ISL-44]|uniref:hypothetical protein n=1 Tax=Streptomyces sp. ISL-44 TaxID=2819184 RepID=UPI001BE9DD64|nr:hypothetical protein [Streptomyces sp. ISL-44]MBT2545626.1 hypothetical protein [Streptomyces sp. ISL-44]